jgi:hypothetical protein
MGRNSSVDIATCWMDEVAGLDYRQRQGHFPSIYSPDLPPIELKARAVSPWVKRPGHEAEHTYI